MAAPSECSHSLPSVWSKCQCVLIKRLIGSELIDARAAVTFGRAPAKPASIISLPSGPGRTAIFPPAPKRTLMLPRNFWAVTVAAAAVFRAVCTSPSFWAKSRRGAIKATVEVAIVDARKLRREIRTSNVVVIQRPFKLIRGFAGDRPMAYRAPKFRFADYSKAAAALAAPLK